MIPGDARIAFGVAGGGWQVAEADGFVSMLFTVPTGQTEGNWPLAVPAAFATEPNTSPKFNLTMNSSANTTAPGYDAEDPDATPKNSICMFGFGVQSGGTIEPGVTMPQTHWSSESCYYSVPHGEWVSEWHIEARWGEADGSIGSRLLSAILTKTSKRTELTIQAHILSFLPDFQNVSSSGRQAVLDFDTGVAALDGVSLSFNGGAGVFRADGSIKPAAMANASAVNDSIFLSTDSGKLSYKTAGGVVESLH